MLGILSKKYQTAGARIRGLREALPLTRQEFCDKHDISFSTLRALENAALKVTPKHAYNLVQAFEREGIVCTEEWLLEGSGDFPTETTPQNTNSKMAPTQNSYKSKIVIEKEIGFFKKSNPNSLVIQIADNTMRPLYKVKDYVGGIKINIPVSKQYYGNPCLVILADGTKLVRILYPGTQDNLFNLGCPFSTDLKKTPFLVNVAVKSIYPIVWHRKSE